MATQKSRDAVEKMREYRNLLKAEEGFRDSLKRTEEQLAFAVKYRPWMERVTLVSGLLLAGELLTGGKLVSNAWWSDAAKKKEMFSPTGSAPSGTAPASASSAGP